MQWASRPGSIPSVSLPATSRPSPARPSTQHVQRVLGKRYRSLVARLSTPLHFSQRRKPCCELDWLQNPHWATPASGCVQRPSSDRASLSSVWSTLKDQDPFLSVAGLGRDTPPRAHAGPAVLARLTKQRVEPRALRFLIRETAFPSIDHRTVTGGRAERKMQIAS